MSDPGDLFALLVEFSIGLAGFSAIVAVFLQEGRGMDPVDRYRVINLLGMSLTPAFVALLTLGLLTFLADPALAARWGCGLAALLMSGQSVYAVIGRRNMQDDVRARLLPTPIWRIMSSLLVANVFIHCSAALGLFASRTAEVLYYGLLVLLAQAVVQFVRIVIARPVQ